MCVCVAGAKAQGCAEMLSGGVVFSLGLQGRAKVVVGFGIVGLERHAPD